MDYYKEVGWLILGTRMKRLGERFLSEISKVYKQFNIQFETSWFPIFFLLHKNNVLILSQISDYLGVTHSAVSQMIANLKNRGIVEILSDNVDERKKYIQLTVHAKKMLPRLLEIWEVLENTMCELLPSTSKRKQFLLNFEKLESELNKNTLSEKAIVKLIKMNKHIQLVPYRSDYEKILTGFLNEEKLNIPVNRRHLLLAVSKKKIIGLAGFSKLDKNIILEKLYLKQSYASTKLAVSMLTKLSKSHLKNKDGYFIVKKPDEQILRYLLKSGYPFMVKQ